MPELDAVAEVAYEAKHKIDSHEEICAVRYEGITTSVVALRADINTLATRMWVAAGSVILACFAVIGFLAAKVT